MRKFIHFDISCSHWTVSHGICVRIGHISFCILNIVVIYRSLLYFENSSHIYLLIKLPHFSHNNNNINSKIKFKNTIVRTTEWNNLISIFLVNFRSKNNRLTAKWKFILYKLTAYTQISYRQIYADEKTISFSG